MLLCLTFNISKVFYLLFNSGKITTLIQACLNIFQKSDPPKKTTEPPEPSGPPLTQDGMDDIEKELELDLENMKLDEDIDTSVRKAKKY